MLARTHLLRSMLATDASKEDNVLEDSGYYEKTRRSRVNGGVHVFTLNGLTKICECLSVVEY